MPLLLAAGLALPSDAPRAWQQTAAGIRLGPGEAVGRAGGDATQTPISLSSTLVSVPQAEAEAVAPEAAKNSRQKQGGNQKAPWGTQPKPWQLS